MPVDSRQSIADAVFGLDDKTAGDAFREFTDHPFNYVPYFNVVEIAQAGNVLRLSRKAIRGEAEQDELFQLNAFMREQQRGSSWGYKVLSTSLRIPSYAIEFLTGGAFIKGAAKQSIRSGAKHTISGTFEKLGAQAAKGLAKTGISLSDDMAKFFADDVSRQFISHSILNVPKIFAKSAKDAAAATTQKKLRDSIIKDSFKLAGRNLKQAGAEAPIRALLMPHRLTLDRIRRQTPSLDITENEQGVFESNLLQEGDGFMSSFFKSFLDLTIENFSERTGENFLFLKQFYGPRASSFLKASIMKTRAMEIGRKTLPGASASQQYGKGFKELMGRYFTGTGSSYGRVDDFFRRTGFNGILNEILEERVGQALRIGVGLQDIRTALPGPLLEQISVEAVAFAINPMIATGIALEPRIRAQDEARRQVYDASKKFYGEGFDSLVLDEEIDPLVDIIDNYLEQKRQQPTGIIEKFQHFMIGKGREKTFESLLQERFGISLDTLAKHQKTTIENNPNSYGYDRNEVRKTVLNELGLFRAGNQSQRERARKDKSIQRAVFDDGRSRWVVDVAAWEEDDLRDFAEQKPGMVDLVSNPSP